MPDETTEPTSNGVAPAPVETYDSYDYTILRVVPRVERGEFINAGVVLSCPRHRFLEARYEVDAARLRAIDPSIDLEAVEAHLAAIARMCRGGAEAGPIGQLTQRERFHWLVAPKSALIQSAPAHAGRCQGDPSMVLERLMDTMVRPPRSRVVPATATVLKDD